MSMGASALHRTRRAWLAPVSAVCLALGAMLALQIRSREVGGLLGENQRPEILASMVASLQQEKASNLEAIAKLKDQLTKLENASAEGKGAVEVLNSQLQEQKAIVGLAAVRGPGIYLYLDDSNLKVGADLPLKVEELMVHDSDLWPIVNELKAAGAEAIAINGQRITPFTAIRCVGSVLKLNINDIRIARPFEITAIGDQNTLYGALTAPDGVIDRLKQLRFPVKLEKRDQIEIPSLAAIPTLKWAKPVAETKLVNSK